MKGLKFTDLELIRGEFKVVWEWLGEGLSGDYNENDEGDEPLLRFSCYKFEAPGFRAEPEWLQMDDASYCTLLKVGTPLKVLAYAAGIILEAIEDVCYKKHLEELSHFCLEDFVFLCKISKGGKHEGRVS